MYELDALSRAAGGRSRSISAENPTGGPGMGGRSAEGYGAAAARDLGIGWKVSPAVTVASGEVFELANVTGQSGEIRHIWITDNAPTRRLVFRIYWDGSDIPSVEVPLNDFFANTDNDVFRQLNSLPVCVNPRRGFNCYWTMPFRTGFRITVENQHSDSVTVYYQFDYLEKEVPADALYFHAQFRRVNPLPYREVFTILDGVHGAGQYVGTYLFWGVNNCDWWGEGEIKFYMDGDRDYPTICGTGTEDYFCGSWNFDVNGEYREFSGPYTGLAKVLKPDGLYRSQQRFSLYRWHITDPVCFRQDLRVTIQALGWRSEGRYLPLQDDISSVAYFYLNRICDTPPQLPDRDGLEVI